MLRLATALLLVATSIAGAQRPTVAVRITVVDSSGSPVSGADVAIVRGMNETAAHAATDNAGRALLTFDRGGDPNQLVVRKIGFERGYRFFSAGSADSLAFTIPLMRAVATLAPVSVTAKEDLKLKSYHLTAEDIESSDRTILDGADLFKLRPDMMSSRGGPKACEVPWTPRDGWIESVWINGQRVNLAQIDSTAVYAKRFQLGVNYVPPPPPSNKFVFGGSNGIVTPPPMFPVFSHIDSAIAILSMVHPEHIAEVTYKDCFDTSVGLSHSDLAMFIALKPGIGFDPGRGTYVVDPFKADAPNTPRRSATAPALPPHRLRLLGVFDLEEGMPLGGVAVVDSASGTTATTTATGTVSLAFLPEGRSTLVLKRDGYTDTTLAVTIAPGDTIPITFVMSRKRPPETESAKLSRNAYPVSYIENLLGARNFERQVQGGWPRG